MRFKSLVGLLAMIAALFVLGLINRGHFKSDTYMLCLGMAGDGPVVTAEEKSLCECMATRAVGAVSWKAWLPRTMIDLTRADNARMVEAQRSCRPEKSS